MVDSFQNRIVGGIRRQIPSRAVRVGALHALEGALAARRASFGALRLALRAESAGYLGSAPPLSRPVVIRLRLRGGLALRRADDNKLGVCVFGHFPLLYSSAASNKCEQEGIHPGLSGD